MGVPTIGVEPGEQGREPKKQDSGSDEWGPGSSEQGSEPSR